jgi:hypothetical protein
MTYKSILFALIVEFDANVFNWIIKWNLADAKIVTCSVTMPYSRNK